MEVEKKKRGAQPGRVMSDAQREGLKKGLDALKAKRELKMKEKEHSTSTVIDLPKETPLVNASVNVPPALVNMPPAALPMVDYKPPQKKNTGRAINLDDLHKLKQEIYEMKQPSTPKIGRAHV